jgi:hypothetical protein
VRQLRDTIIELLREEFSVRSMPSVISRSLRVQLDVRLTPASKDVNTEAVETTALEAVAR